MKMRRLAMKACEMERLSLCKTTQATERSNLWDMQDKINMNMDKMFANDEDTEQLTESDMNMIATLMVKYASRLSDSK